MIRKMLLVAVALAPFAAQATDGYFSHGYGMKSKGRAGASAAMTDDAFGGANNPATMAFAGSRMDLGLDWFRPDRSAISAKSLCAAAVVRTVHDVDVMGGWWAGQPRAVPQSKRVISPRRETRRIDPPRYRPSRPEQQLELRRACIQDRAPVRRQPPA